jgi:hypothetical protein
LFILTEQRKQREQPYTKSSIQFVKTLWFACFTFVPSGKITADYALQYNHLVFDFRNGLFGISINQS